MSRSTCARLSGSGSAALAALLVAASACSDATTPASPAATAGQPAAGSSAGSTAAGASGVAGSSGAGAANTGGQEPTSQSGAASQAGAGGSAGAAAGSSGAGSGGLAGTGGSGPADDKAAFAALHGYQLLDPCDLTNYKVEASAGAVCPQLNSVKNQHVSRQVAGDPNVTYNVTLRVRGIMEGYWYDGGTLDPVSKTFYTGGVPTVGGFSSACKNKASELPFQLPSEVAPTDGCFNGFNMFAMTVSAPKQHFYLNYTAEKDGDRPPHAVYEQDYTVTVALKGQATLDFYIVGSDEHQCYNHNKVIDGVTLTSSPYIGEFVQFDVVDVKRAP
jgi:hypothetical protein